MDLSLDYIIPKTIVPIDKLQCSEDWDSLFNRISIKEFQINKHYPSGSDELLLSLSYLEEIIMNFLDLDIIYIIFGGEESELLNVRILLDPSEILFQLTGNIRIRISNDILKPVRESNGDWVPDNEHVYSEIVIDTTAQINHLWDVSFMAGSNLSLQPSQIGDTNLILEINSLKLDLSSTSSPEEIIEAGYGETFKGIYIGLGQIIIPFLSEDSEEDSIPLTLTLEKAIIGNGGFGGTVSAEWDVVLNNDKTDFVDESCGMKCNLFDDFEVAIQRVSIVFDKNVPSEFSIEGALKLPFFGSVVNVELSLGEGGEILVGLRGFGDDGLLKLTKEQLFELQVNAFQFKRTAEETAFTVDGDFQITATDMIPKIGLQRFTVYKLREDDWTNPRLRLEGGTLDINKSFDINAFRVDIIEIGFGERDGVNNLIFSGGIQLLEGIDAGAWVKGLRIPLEAGGSISLDGVGLLVVSPDSFEFKGEIEHKEELNKSLYMGGIALNIIPIGMGIESQILVGRNPNCAFAYIHAKLFFPGIGYQIGTLPLYIRAAEILLGKGVTLDADEIHEYFPLSQRSPIGITHASKWRDECGAYAIGMGVDISTANERLFYMNALLALLFPDLKLLIEGTAFVLEKPSIGKKPPFHTLTVMQKDPFAALINVSAQYEFIKGVINAHGVMEAYYGPDPANPGKTIWYHTLGQIKPYFPADKPIHVKILQIFDATGYLMIMPGLWVTGAQIGLSKNYDFRVISVDFEALITGEVELRWDPEQIKGWLEQVGRVGFKIYRKGFDISLSADVKGMASDWLIDALLQFGVSFKLLWKKFEYEGEIPFHWEKRTTPPIPDVFDQITITHAVETKSWEPLVLDDETLPAFSDIPNVEPDCQPVISFRFAVKDMTGQPFGQNIQSFPDHKSGDYTFRANLDTVRMWRCPVKDYEAGNIEWEELGMASSQQVKYTMFYGTWQAVEDPDGLIGATHLQLFAKTPFEFDRNRVLSRQEYGQVFQEHFPESETVDPSFFAEADSPKATSNSGPVAPVIKPMKSIRQYDSPHQYPLKTANLVKNEFSTYPFTGIDKNIKKVSVNFLGLEPDSYSRRKTLAVGQSQLGSTRGFQISKDDYYPYSLNYLEITGDIKNPNHLLISFKEPVRRLELHYISATNWKTPPIEVEASYKRQQPELGPWNFEKKNTIPVSIQEEEEKIIVSCDITKSGSNNNFDLVQVRVNSQLRVLSISYDIDKSEELAAYRAQLERFLDITYRQRQFNLPSSTEITDVSEEMEPLSTEGQIAPGYVYKIQVDSSVSRSNGGVSGPVLSQRFAYFMAKDPPVSLKPYVLRTYPKLSGCPQYRSGRLFIRYLKNYVRNLFPEGYGKLNCKITNEHMVDQILEYGNETTGWKWVRATDHVLTREELFWMEAYNQNISPDNQLSDEMILGDDVMQVSLEDPVLMRATFDSEISNWFSEISEDDIPPGESTVTRWLRESGTLHHSLQTLDEESMEGESQLLTEIQHEAEYIISYWLRPEKSTGETGLILLRHEDISEYTNYIRLSIDMRENRVRLIKEPRDNGVPGSYI